MPRITPPLRAEPLIDEQGRFTLRWSEYFEDSATEINESADTVDTNKTLMFQTQSDEQERTNVLPFPQQSFNVQVFRAVTVTNSYTAVDHDFINVTSSALIKFPEFPEESSIIVIRNGSGLFVKLDGNGKNINGSSTGVLRRKGTAIEFYYFIDSDEWFAK